MDISVIICTWNNAKRLAITLETLTECLVPQNIQWQIVLVNNNCADDTDAVVRRFEGRLPLLYIREPKQGLSNARNAGLNAAEGRLVVFTDDDIKPRPEWLGAYWNVYREKPSGFYFGGPIESDYEGTGLDRDLLPVAPESVKGFNLGDAPVVLNPSRVFIGSNWACPMEILKKSGGFDPNRGLNPSTGKVLTGEETDLMNRLNKMGWKGYYIPEAKIKHFVPKEKCTLPHIALRSEAYGHEQAGADPNSRNPLLLHIRLGIKYLRWVAKKIQGKNGYEEYISYRYVVGLKRGIRELKTEKRFQRAGVYESAC